MSQLKAVIFGAIGTIVETSELQRQAFNLAFAEAGLSWNWSAQTYRDLLNINGGQNRIRAYHAAVRLEPGAVEVAHRPKHDLRHDITDVQIAAIHQAKTKHYVTLLATTPIYPRTGVVELIEACKQSEIQVAFCTSTSIENVAGIRKALSGSLPFDRFAQIVTIEQIDRPKPAPDAYLYCLQQLGLTANEVIALEDTPVSITAAQAAGIVTIATPGATTSDQDFTAADLVVSDLTGVTVDRLSQLLQTRQIAEKSRY